MRVDRRQHRGLRDAVAFANRNVAHDARGRRRDAVVGEVGAGGPDLLLHRAQLRLGRFQRVGRAIGVHLAGGAGREQLRRALGFLPRVGDVDLALRAHGFEACQRACCTRESISISSAPGVDAMTRLHGECG